MYEAFIQDAEHNIDRDECSQQQQRLCTDRLLERLYIAGEIRMDDVGDAHFGDGPLERAGGVFDRGAGPQIVGDGH